MLDWEITEERELPSSEERQPTDAPRRSRLAFVLIIGGILTVALIITGVMTWRLQRAEETLEADLLAQIRAEENARRFGEREALSRWITDAVPRDWRNRFSAQFQPPRGEVRPIEITIDHLELNGNRAMVTVRMGAQLQRRAYQLYDVGWRRVPLVVDSDTFGTNHFTRTLENRVEIYFYKRDEPFAHQLAGDLVVLDQTVRAWYGDSANWNMRPPLIPPIINIQPQELTTALTDSEWDDGTGLYINSPQVVLLSPTWDVSGESAVRFALANLIWNQVPVQSVNIRALPAVHRFANATRMVMALRWALSASEYAALQADWRAQLAETEWQSPFFALTNDVELNPFAPTDEALRLLLMADGVVEATGINTPEMAQILPALEASQHWDQFFETITGQKTLAFEAMVIGAEPPAPLPMPFVASRSNAADDNTTLRGFAVQAEGHPYPITIEGEGGANVILPNGESFNPLCVSMLGELEITGTWREEGLRLQPTEIRVRRLALPTTFTEALPPQNTVAYVSGYVDEASNSFGRTIARISALGDDGQLTPILVPADPTVLELGNYGWGMTDSTTGVLLTSTASRQGCTARWYLRYVPGRGITGAWLTEHNNPDTFLQVRWDDVTGRGILVELKSDTASATSGGSPGQTPFWWLEEGEPQVIGVPDGYLPEGSGFFLAPGATTGAMYRLVEGDTQRSAMVVVDLATQRQEAVYTAPDPAYYATDFAFSGDGTALYLIWSMAVADGTGMEGSLLQRVDLATGAVEEWWSPEQGLIFFVAPDLRSPHLYAMTMTSNDPGGVRLMNLDGNGATLVGGGGDAFGISLLRRCADGGLLYLRLDTPTEQETRYELDPRYVHIIPPDADENDAGRVFPLSATHLPLLCP